MDKSGLDRVRDRLTTSRASRTTRVLHTHKKEGGMMGVGSGDQLARGAVRAQFQTPQVSDEKWEKAIGGEKRKKNILTDAERELAAAEIARLEAATPVAAPEPKKVRAVLDRIIVRRVETENVVGSLFLPDESKEKPSEGIVIAVGPGRYVEGYLQRPTVNVGERVVFGKYSGAEVKIGLEPALVLHEEDIFYIKEN
jgi:chaperonin GroES